MSDDIVVPVIEVEPDGAPTADQMGRMLAEHRKLVSGAWGYQRCGGVVEPTMSPGRWQIVDVDDPATSELIVMLVNSFPGTCAALARSHELAAEEKNERSKLSSQLEQLQAAHDDAAATAVALAAENEMIMRVVGRTPLGARFSDGLAKSRARAMQALADALRDELDEARSMPAPGTVASAEAEVNDLRRINDALRAALAVAESGATTARTAAAGIEKDLIAARKILADAVAENDRLKVDNEALGREVAAQGDEVLRDALNAATARAVAAVNILTGPGVLGAGAVSSAVAAMRAVCDEVHRARLSYLKGGL